MKVVQINCSSSGSTGGIAKSIHRQLLKEGNDSYIFYGFGKNDAPNMLRIDSWFELHAHAVLSRYLGLQGYFSCFSTLKMLRRIKRIDPDIIHLHNLHGSYINLPMLFAYLKRSRARVIITLHDCWLFTGKCPHFTVIGCERWKSECGSCPQLDIYPAARIDTTKKCLQDKRKWLQGIEDKVQLITVSEWLKEKTLESFLSRYPVKCILNGIDEDSFYPRNRNKARKKYNITSKTIILGVSSVWNKNKGYDDFLKLSQLLSDDEVIIMVGLNKEQICGLPNNIIGIEHTESKDELAELYSAADVLINFSREESFGLVTLEAMACGTPVIAYNSTACAEFINENCGYIAEPGNIDQVRSYLNNIENGLIKRTFNIFHTRSNMVDLYIDTYRSVYEA